MFDSIKDQATHALNWAASGSKITYAAIAVGLVVALILFRLFFKSVAGLFHSIGFSFGSGGNPTVAAEPGLCSSSRLKLLLIALVPAGTAYAAYMLLPTLFPAVFH
jgi:hypothetical protein